MSGSLPRLAPNGKVLVLDTWPLMEWYRRREPGSTLFGALLTLAAQQGTELHMSRLNRGEAYYSVAKNFGLVRAAAFRTSMRFLPIRFESVTDDDVDNAAELKARYAISYADAFAATLTSGLQAVLVTGDPDFLPLAADGYLQLHWIGQ